MIRLLLTLIVAVSLINKLSADSVVDCPNEPNTLPSNFIVRLPNGCSSDCDFVARIGPNQENDTFVDFHIEAKVSGYTAIGFSEDSKMPSSDVVGCWRNNSDLVIRDTWNIANGYCNVDDPNQDGVCPYSASYQDNTIKCSFSRFSGILNPGFDYDLNGSYFLLMVFSNNQVTKCGGFPEHSLQTLPTVTADQVYVYENIDGNNATTSDTLGPMLIRAHGVLMTVAWPFLAVIGIFFAAWTKPAFPKGQWFQFHRALMISSIVVALVGFALVFIANKDSSVPGLVELSSCNRKLSHFGIGIIVTTFQVLNPLIALCRCKPESEYRFIFNLVHGSGVGILTEILALVNVALGIGLFQSDCGSITSANHILWIYIGWLCFFVIYQVGLFIFFTVSAISNREERANLAPSLINPFFKPYHHENTMELNDTTELSGLHDAKDLDLSDDTKKSKDGNIRNGALGIFSVVTLIVAIILVVLIAIDKGSDD